jgi:hypothetical protein
VCERLADRADRLQELTGLPLDPYFVAPKLGRFVLRTTELRARARLQVRQGDRLLFSSRPRRLVPTRFIPLPAAWLARVDPDGPPLEAGLR